MGIHTIEESVSSAGERSVNRKFRLMMTVCSLLRRYFGCWRWPFLVFASATAFFLYLSYTYCLGDEKNRIGLQTNALHVLSYGNGSLKETLDNSLFNSCWSAHPSSSRRFVIGLNFWEQMNMGTSNLFGLVRVASELQAQVVAPFIHNSRLYGLPGFIADEKWSTNAPSHSMGLIYDMDKFNQLSCHFGMLPFANFYEDFLPWSTKKLKVVHFIHVVEAREHPLMVGHSAKLIKQKFAASHIVDCHDVPSVQPFMTAILTTVNMEAIKTNSTAFDIAEYLCVNASHPTDPTYLAQQCGLTSTGFSLLVVNWRGFSSHHMVEKAAKGSHTSHKTYITNLKHTQHPSAPRDVFPFNRYIINNASQFLQKLVKGSDFIGIHVRSEKLGQRNQRIKNFLSNCFNSALELRDMLLSQPENSGLPVIFFTDHGVHGSDSCLSCTGAKAIDKLFSEQNIAPVHFDPTMLQASSMDHVIVNDSGFVASVEMSALSRAKHIILVGGGAYEKQAGLRFRELATSARKATTQSQRLLEVCWDDSGQYKSRQVWSSVPDRLND